MHGDRLAATDDLDPVDIALRQNFLMAIARWNRVIVVAVAHQRQRRDARRETNFPLERHKDSPIINDDIIACMKRYGYDWTSDHRRCREALVATNPFCYLPTKGFDRWFTRLQMALE